MASESETGIQKQKSVLFVCLGNTCRSTMSEGIFEHLIKEKGVQDQWMVDSAAIADWQLGNPPDPKTMNMLWENNITGYDHVARQIKEEDFWKFQFILGMDRWNYRRLKDIAPNGCTAHIGLLGQYDQKGEDIEIYDPFMNDQSVFEEVYKKCFRCCSNFLAANAADENNIK